MEFLNLRIIDETAGVGTRAIKEVPAMQRFRKILMVYNEAPNHHPAMSHVITLAGRTGAQLTFVDVLDDLHLPPGAVHTALPDDLLALRREDIAAVLAKCGADLVQVAIKVLVGNLPVAIIQEVLRDGHDLVVKTAQGPDMGLGGRLFGSTAIKLMRKCPVPVWAFKPAPEIRFPRVLAAVGPPAEDRQDNRLNEEIVSLAAAFTRASAGCLDILHCWQLPGESLLTSGLTRIPSETLEAMRAQVQTRSRRHLEATLHTVDLTDVTHQIHLKPGPVVELLPAHIAAQAIDLVVMGSLAQPGIAGLIAGSNAEQIFNTANCAVMVIKPPGFVSPIVA
jgi:nucleotide-binding universal stress UspA family protein